MSLIHLDNQDLEKIVQAAIRWEETNTRPTEVCIAAIGDGDEDIPVIIENMMKQRLLGTWRTHDEGLVLLKVERNQHMIWEGEFIDYDEVS